MYHTCSSQSWFNSPDIPSMILKHELHTRRIGVAVCPHTWTTCCLYWSSSLSCYLVSSSCLLLGYSKFSLSTMLICFFLSVLFLILIIKSSFIYFYHHRCFSRVQRKLFQQTNHVSFSYNSVTQNEISF